MYGHADVNDPGMTGKINPHRDRAFGFVRSRAFEIPGMHRVFEVSVLVN